ncbi:MAG: phosphopyruvate hydratase [Candidatus Aenigmatarchaeota archaeon]
MRVLDIKLRKVLASNSKITTEVELKTSKGVVYSSVPFGTSKSKYEVKYLPFEKVKENFLRIKKYLIDDFDELKDVDELIHSIDKTEDLREIGGNLALAISYSFLKAFAMEENLPVFYYLNKNPQIPKPVCNVAGGWNKQSDIQEFLLLPIHQESFQESIEEISNIYLKLADELKKSDKNFNYSKNLESAWVTSLKTEEILEILERIKTENIALGLDVAASNLWSGERYIYKDKELSTMQQIEYMVDLQRKFKLFYVEDPFHQDDFVSFSVFTKNSNCLVVGDDIYATNVKRLKLGLDIKATNAVLVKPNQIGTVTDALNFVKEAKKNNLKIVVSHRSAETDDNILSHLAVGFGADYFKLGISGERIVKINEMIRIEEAINELK